MKISKGTIAFGLSILATIISSAATWFEVKDSIDECKEMYRDEIRAIVNEERENCTKSS